MQTKDGSSNFVWYGAINGLNKRNQNIFMYAYLKPNHDNSLTYVGDKVNRELKWRLHIRAKNSNVRDWNDFPEQDV